MTSPIDPIRAALEAAAKLLDARGVSACERGATDYSTGQFECRKLDRGECNCNEFDELAEEIRALPVSAGEPVACPDERNK